MTDDPWNLARFRAAQASGGAYDTALQELRAGRKRSHWVWFVLPQIAGVGHSPMAQRYAVSGLDEARGYLADPELGPRLLDCAQTLTGLDETDAVTVMGSVDAMKLRSCMTLFLHAATLADHRAAFATVLDQFFGGQEDRETLVRLDLNP